MAKHVAGFSYTDAELLALFREALAHIAAGGQSYKLGSVEYVRADLPVILKTITSLEQRISTATQTGPAQNLAQRGRLS